MKFSTSKCKNCGADVTLDIDNLGTYCPYCGAKDPFDSDIIRTYIKETEKTKRIREYTNRKELPYKYTKEQDIRDKKHDLHTTLIAVLMLVCLFIAGGVMAFREERGHVKNNDIKLTFSDDELKNTSLEHVEQVLKSAGFSNIEFIENGNLITKFVGKGGKVTKVSINNDSSFNSGDWFPANSEIEVVYNP